MTTKTNDCRSKGLCHYVGATRTKFFHGMLLTDEHLRLEQTYHREALHRVHRYLWGPGIVCGFEVEWVSALCLKIHPGLAIDCQGFAIELCECLTIDLGDECKKQYPGGCTPKDAKPFTRYLALRYAAIEDEPQPVLTTGDECGGASRCEKSRVREGFCLDLLDECPPPCEEKKPEKKDEGQAVQAAAGPVRGIPEWMKPLRQCPPCECGCGCDACAIGLAKLIVDCDKATISVEPGCRTYAHARVERDTIHGGLSKQDQKLKDLDRTLAETTRRVEALERLRKQGEPRPRQRGAPPSVETQ